MSHVSCVSLQLNNSPGYWVKELFKPSKDAAGLLVCIWKNWKVLDLGFFVGAVISGIGLGILAKVIGPWASATQEPIFDSSVFGN